MKSTGDIKLRSLERIAKYDDILDWAVKWLRLNWLPLVERLAIATVFLAIGYIAAAPMVFGADVGIIALVVVLTLGGFLAGTLFGGGIKVAVGPYENEDEE